MRILAEVTGVRELSLNEWDYVSGGDGTPSVPPPPDPAPNTAVNDIYNQIVGQLGVTMPTPWVSPAALIADAIPGTGFHSETCTMPDGSGGNQWVSNDDSDFFFPCGEPDSNGQLP